MNYLSTSEFVTSGHPDRIADNIAAVIIRDISFKDGINSHSAIEVFLTHDTVIIAGEATTTLKLNKAYLKKAVAEGYRLSGYLPTSRQFWSKKELCLPADLKIINKVSCQSPDIALGTTDKGKFSGWNDQGVYFSSSQDNSQFSPSTATENPREDLVSMPPQVAKTLLDIPPLNKSNLGVAHHIATSLGNYFKSIATRRITFDFDSRPFFVIGPDIKVLVTVLVDDNGQLASSTHFIKAITLAIPHSNISNIEEFKSWAIFLSKSFLNSLYGVDCIAPDCKWTVNGTGRFVVHGNISDCSMTGRKISVNHPSAGPVSSAKMIGGGSLVKTYNHASDFLLNVASRFIANVIVHAGYAKYAIVGCSGSIGQVGLDSLFIKLSYISPEHLPLNAPSSAILSYNSDIHTAIELFFTEHHKSWWSPRGLAVDLFHLFNEDGSANTAFDFAKCVDSNFFGNPEYHPWDNEDIIAPVAEELESYVTDFLRASYKLDSVKVSATNPVADTPVDVGAPVKKSTSKKSTKTSTKKSTKNSTAKSDKTSTKTSGKTSSKKTSGKTSASKSTKKSTKNPPEKELVYHETIL